MREAAECERFNKKSGHARGRVASWHDSGSLRLLTMHDYEFKDKKSGHATGRVENWHDSGFLRLLILFLNFFVQRGCD